MSTSVVPLSVHGVWLALPAPSLVEVLGRCTWVPVAGAPAELPGVIPWRGRAIALLDIGRLMAGTEPLQPGESRRRTLVLSHDGCTLALPVDEVREVQELADDRVHPASATRQRFADREVELDGMPVPLLDPAQIIASFAQAEAAP
jgi:chemotaxis signal transduction protein